MSSPSRTIPLLGLVLCMSIAGCSSAPEIRVAFAPRAKKRIAELRKKTLRMPAGGSGLEEAAQIEIRNATWKTVGMNPIQGHLFFEYRMKVTDKHEPGTDVKDLDFKPISKKWATAKEQYAYVSGEWSLVGKIGPPGW